MIEGNRPRGIPSAIGDTDFGGTPMLFQPEGSDPLAAINSKNGHNYVWRRHRLSGGPIWSSTEIAPIEPNNSFIGQPSYSKKHQMAFVSHTFVWQDGQRFGGLTAFRMDEDFTFTKAWATPTGEGPQPPPIVVGDVVFSTTGAFSGDRDLVSLDARTGRLLWSGSVEGTVWAPPIADGGRVFAGSADGNLVAFALPKQR